MMTFINNGGLEMMLGMLYLTYIIVMAKVENRRVEHKKEIPTKWYW